MKHFEDIQKKLPADMRLKYYINDLYHSDSSVVLTDKYNKMSEIDFKVNAMGHDYISDDRWSEIKNKLHRYYFENIKFQYYSPSKKRAFAKVIEKMEVEAFTFGQAKNMLEMYVLSYCTQGYNDYALKNGNACPPVAEFGTFMETGLSLVPALLFLGGFSYTYAGQAPCYGNWSYNNAYVIRVLAPMLGLIPDVLVKEMGYEKAVEYVSLCMADENVLKAVTTPGLYNDALEYCSKFWTFSDKEKEMFRQASLTDRSPKVSVC